MPILEFGEYTPDRPDLATGVNAATNVYPAAIGYIKVPGLAVFGDPTEARPIGAITVKDKDRNVFNYVGTTTKIFSNSSGSTFNDASGATFTTAEGERWEFVHWKEKVLATNFSDFPREITIGASLFSILTNDLRARHIAVVRNFVVFGNTFDGSDGNVPYRVRWSALDDETDYTVSPVTLSDFQDLKGIGGQITKVVGGEFGVIFQERAVWRMSFVGSPAVFQFDNVLPSRGTRAPSSVVQAGARIFFLSQDGFEMLVNGTQLVPIGTGRVNRTFFADLDISNIDRMNGVADVKNNRVLWSYPGAGNINGRPNKIIVFDWVLDKWSLIELEVELLTNAATTGVSLDDLDTVMASWGSELITDGGFSSASNWTTDAGWSVAAGLASHTAGTSDDVEQSVVITSGQFYFVTYTIANRTAGSVTVKVGGTSGTAQTDNDTHTETIEAGSSNSLIEFTASSDFDGDIDNVSIRQTSIDLIQASLDSEDFIGGAFALAAYDSSFQLSFFNGSALQAIIETLEIQFTPEQRSRIIGFRPIVDGGGEAITVTVEAKGRNRQTAQETTGATTSEETSGRYSRRSNARYHRFKLTINGEFENASAIDVEAVAAGGRR